MEQNRDKTIIKTSIIGIIVNAALAAFKAFIGLISGSVAIVMDAVNNLSDAMSSIITILGTWLSGKEPDKKHPLGYGRIESLSALTISIIILYAGVTSLIESVKKIIHPARPNYTLISLVIIAVAVLVKMVLGLYVIKKGKEVKSTPLIASGSDAEHDAIISVATLAAALIFIFTKISLEAWLGALISVLILKSGFEMLRDIISEIIGQRIDPEFSKAIRTTINETDGVIGAYDLIVNNYGVARQIGSVHIEVPDTMTVKELDKVEREVAMRVFKKHHVILTGISVYSMNTDDIEATKAEHKVRNLLENYPDVLEMHGFYMDREHDAINFDIIISYNAPDRRSLYKEINKKAGELFPGKTVSIQLDSDISD